MLFPAPAVSPPSAVLSIMHGRYESFVPTVHDGNDEDGEEKVVMVMVKAH